MSSGPPPLRGGHQEDFVRKEISRLNPREILLQESLLDKEYFRSLTSRPAMVLNKIPDWLFDQESSFKTLKDQFHVSNMKGFGFQDSDRALAAAGVLLDYLKDTARHYLTHLQGIRRYEDDRFVSLDEATQKNLELLRNMNDGSDAYTLLSVLDESRTSMGARMLRQWIMNPLRLVEDIRYRQERVKKFYHNQLLIQDIRDILSGILDVERLTARIGLDKAHAKDLLSLRVSLEKIFAIDDRIQGEENDLIVCLPEQRNVLQGVAELLGRSICDDPSILLHEGRMIREGYHAELDELKQLKNHSRQILDDYLQGIKDETGITNLKLKYNKIIGYFLEVSKAQTASVPDTFIRRQSLVGSERYTTDRLGELESGINSASEKIVELERNLFLEIRGRTENTYTTAAGGLFKTGGTGLLSEPGLYSNSQGVQLPRDPGQPGTPCGGRTASRGGSLSSPGGIYSQYG